MPTREPTRERGREPDGTPLALKRPGAVRLARVSDRATFLYLDRSRIVQDENGVAAQIVTGDRVERTTYLPVATIACLLLGPGTTLTQAAAATMSRAGCAVAFVGAGGVRSYSVFSPLSSSTDLLLAQASLVSNQERRIEAARWMYAKRFPGALPPGLSIEQLRGLEGARVKALYSLAASKHRLPKWKRNRGELGEMDAVNVALNYANTALYGLVNSVVLALGLSPGLGVVHEGQRQAFVLDIADLYKAELTIPLAFSLWKSEDPGRDAMHALRKDFRLLKLLPRVVDDIYELLGLEPELLDDDSDGWDVEVLNLWAPSGLVAAGVNYAREALIDQGDL